MDKTLYIFGGSSTALEIAEAAEIDCDRAFSQVVLVVPPSEMHNGKSRICIDDLDRHAAANAPAGYIISMIDQRIRNRCYEAAMHAGLRPISVVHPQAFVSPSAKIADGVYIAGFAVVSAEANVSSHAIVNFQCVVGHHSQIGDHTILNPGAKVGGSCMIGQRVRIGANSFVYQTKRIGDDVVIDAMTYVDCDVKAGHIVSCRNENGRPVRRPFI